MSYACFAEHYDSLTSNVDYTEGAAYLCDLLSRYLRKPPALLLDLACGTGSLSVEFAKRGIEVIGVDSSVEMLSTAQEKARLQDLSVLFLCQQMQKLDLYGTVDCAVCTLDSINHLTDPEDVRRTFERVSLFLEPGGIFIFDVNTVYKHEQVLAGQSYVYDLDEIYCVWQCEYQPDTRIVEIDLDFFVPDGNCYYRSCESFCERAYPYEDLALWLHEAGLEILDVFAEQSMREVRSDTQRAVYVAEKIK